MPSGGGGFIPAQQGIVAAAQRAAAQAAALREDSLRRKAASNQKLWEVAQEADRGGDLRTAAMIYRRLSLRRPVSQITKSSQTRLSEIQDEAFDKLQAIEKRLNDLKRVEKPFRPGPLDEPKVIKAFEDLDALSIEYAGIATIESRIEDRRKSLRSHAQFAEILQEPAAAELWELARKYEQQDQVCCAFQVYEQAATLVPAPSAKLARTRLNELKADKVAVAAAERCSTLQLCHQKFNDAQRLKGSNPDKAREHLARILELAPADTSIHRAAREQIAMLQ